MTDWLNILILWAGPISWLLMGGWAFRHHVEQPTTKPEYLLSIFFFSVVLSPFSAGIAIWEIRHAKSLTPGAQDGR